MAADPVVLTIPAEIREPLDAACFVFPEEAYTGGSLRGSLVMAASLSRYGRSFATRERGRRLAEEVLVFEREPRVTVDFTDAITAPSFLQGFLARLAKEAEHITLTGVDERLLPMVGRVARASGLAHKVTVEGVPAATAGT